MKKVIFVEPRIINIQQIEDFFRNNNPDSSFVNPHICLVFPFNSNKSKEEMKSILLESLFDINVFEIELSDFSVSYEENNNFLFLNVLNNDNLSKISNRLYEKLSDDASLKGTYKPHVTIGKSSSIDEINKMRADIAVLEGIKFKGIIDKVYCKLLDKDSNGETILKEEVEIILKSK